MDTLEKKIKKATGRKPGEGYGFIRIDDNAFEVWRIEDEVRLSIDMNTEKNMDEKIIKFLSKYNFNITYDELYSRLLRGWQYKMQNDSITIRTGIGGARLFLKTCRIKNLPAVVADRLLTVSTEAGDLHLSDLKVVKCD